MAKDYQIITWKEKDVPTKHFGPVVEQLSTIAKNKKALCDTIRELIAEGFSDIHIKVIERE